MIAFVSGRTEIVPERQRFALFPEKIGAWQGHASRLDSETQRGLGVDDYVLSDFNVPGGRSVNLYVAYYASQRTGVSPHSPSVCIPGGGWLITKLEQISHSVNGIEMPMNRIIIERDAHKQLVYYWFSERGRLMADEYLVKAYLLADAITMNRTDGAMVRLTTRVFPGETEQGADLRLQSFMRLVAPSLDTYLPAREASLPMPSNTTSSAARS
jgi:EpsI family protein